MAVDAVDRKDCSGCTMDGAECSLALNRIKRKFSLLDFFQYKSSHLGYSWDNKKRHRH